MKAATPMDGQRAGKFLVTGAVGQIGAELTLALRRRYGGDNVIATGRRTGPPADLADSGPFEWLDVTDRDRLRDICAEFRIDIILNLAALLSAEGEDDPQLAWQVNVNGLINCLEVARELELARVLCPSSIAVFGVGAPRDNTPQDTVLRPTTMYGVSKVTGELLAAYYAQRYGVDARGLRFPGVISAVSLPGGGTTDYAVDMFYKAVEAGRYTCFVREDTRLPMIYMPDCIKATITLMEADRDRLTRQSDYNLASMSFSAGELAAAIRAHLPNFEVSYEPDHRQAIADSWPRSIDDTDARRDWDWAPDFDLQTMTANMLTQLTQRQAEGRLYR